MSEIKTTYTKEQIAEYLKENNIDVLNSFQIGAKLMQNDERLERIENFLSKTLDPKIKRVILSTANEDHN